MVEKRFGVAECVFLLLDDGGERLAAPGVSLPVGAVTVSIGGLYLIWLLGRETKTR